MKQAVGTSLLIIAAKSLIGFTGDLGNSTINWTLLLSVTALAIAGIFIGDKLSKRIDGNQLKKGFGWFVLLMGLYIIIQQLLFPRTIQFHPTDSLLFEELLPQIKQLGFDVEPFGNNVFIINGVPAEMDKASGDKMLEDILHEFKELQSFNQWSKAEKLAYSFAVKTILKDYTFKQEELNHLIQQLMACADSLVAPNGQLILKKLSQSDLKNLFL
jgi:DNA mismatch repair ATPase MutL